MNNLSPNIFESRPVKGLRSTSMFVSMKGL
nr:MAG TPA: hypothetical protein [Crassvirales sp.]